MNMDVSHSVRVNLKISNLKISSIYVMSLKLPVYATFSFLFLFISSFFVLFGWIYLSISHVTGTG